MSMNIIFYNIANPFINDKKKILKTANNFCDVVYNYTV